MAQFLVTIKLPANPAHNPRAKVEGKCPVNGAYCSDTTGAHHTLLVNAHTREGAIGWTNSVHGNPHITRIEEG